MQSHLALRDSLPYRKSKLAECSDGLLVGLLITHSQSRWLPVGFLEGICKLGT
jgi:hypothetical protein